MRLVAVALALAASLAGCGVDDLAFRDDDRVEIVSPRDRDEVRLPVTLRWSSRLEAPRGGGPYYAVFVDRAPIRPGQSLRALADDSCKRLPDCPDLEYLRDRHVYVTDERRLTLDAVPHRRSTDRHEATIVLIDRDGRRVGEAAYTVEFDVEDDA